MLGIHDSWIPEGFTGWRYKGKIIDAHVHVNATKPTLKTFCDVSKSFGTNHVGTIVHGFAWFDALPGKGLTHHYLPFLSYQKGKGMIMPDILGDMRDEGARGVKYWFATDYFRGRKRIDTQEFASFLRKIGEHGLVATIHISNPDSWHERYYPKKVYGSKSDIRNQIFWLVSEAPETDFVLVHMGGNPENPRGLAEKLDEFDNLYYDTSATKWVSRELSFHHDDAKALFNAHPDRILFGTDIVVPPHNQGKLTDEEYYGTRYFVQRLMLETRGPFLSPIDDPDNSDDKPLIGLNLNNSILEKIYHVNAEKLGLC